jgi:hypothetical protein
MAWQKRFSATYQALAIRERLALPTWDRPKQLVE